MNEDEDIADKPILKMKRANIKIYDEDDNDYDKFKELNSKEAIINKKLSYVSDQNIQNHIITHQEINLNFDDEEEEGDNQESRKHIEELKKLKYKKHQIEGHEEKYDQDYIEVKNMNGSDLIKSNYFVTKVDIYQSFEKNDIFNLKNTEDHSDSEKELLQWEFEKLKNGMAANCKYFSNSGAVNKHVTKPTRQESHNLGETFTHMNIDVSLDDIMSQVQNDIKDKAVTLF